MLQVSRLSKAYGASPLFDNVSFTVGRREKVGLVGRNGHGKSTLFKLIIGQEEEDSGDIVIPKDYHVGYLAQNLHFVSPTVLEEACLGLHPDERELTYKAERILSGLGFSQEGMMESPQSFSGGFQLRINLAKVLLSEPDLLLLDEPTNYLDIVSIRWLTKELQDWKGELMMISHDREFMDTISTHTMGIHRASVKKVPGGTFKYYEQLAQEEEQYEKTRVNQEKKREEIEAFVNRFKAQASKANLVQSRIKQLERNQIGSKLDQIKTLSFSFSEKPIEAKTLLQCDNLSFKYQTENEEAPYLFDNLSFGVKKGDRIGIIGKNGRGKSTLLKVIAGELEALNGEIKQHEKTSIGFFGQTNVLKLNLNNTVEKEIEFSNNDLSRTQVRGICGMMMFDGNKAEKKISVLSGGERSRVLLGKIIATPSNLLMLDEPTSHLDMESIDSLIESIEEFSGGVLIVTHSEAILNRLCTKLIIFNRGEVEVFDGNYEEFLEAKGWEDEDSESDKKKKKNKPSKSIYTESLSKEKQKEIREIKKKMEMLEKEYSKIDQKRKSIEDLLVKASQQGIAEEIKKLSSENKMLEKKSTELLQELEKLMVIEESEGSSANAV